MIKSKTAVAFCWEVNAVGEHEVKIGLEGAIERQKSSLTWLWTEHCKKQSVMSFDEYLIQIDELLESGVINQESMGNDHAEYLKRKEGLGRAHLTRLSCIFYVQSQRFYEGGNREACWMLLTRSCMLAGSVETLTQGVIDQENILKYVTRASKGGVAAKARNSIKAQEEIIRLLQEKSPEGGWIDDQAAIEDLKDELINFIKNNKLALVPARIGITINRWIKKEPSIKSAFENACAKKIRNDLVDHASSN